jgi:arsenate reductase
LFVSKRNAMRSLLAEAILRELGGGVFKAFSCGVPGQVAKEMSPIALQALNKAGIATDGLRPKDWSFLASSGAPRMDVVITLDATLGFLQPPWPGQPEQALWSLPDLDLIHSPAQQQTEATRLLYALQRRLDLLAALHQKAQGPRELRDDLRDLARH